MNVVDTLLRGPPCILTFLRRTVVSSTDFPLTNVDTEGGPAPPPSGRPRPNQTSDRDERGRHVAAGTYMILQAPEEQPRHANGRASRGVGGQVAAAPPLEGQVSD